MKTAEEWTDEVFRGPAAGHWQRVKFIMTKALREAAEEMLERCVEIAGGVADKFERHSLQADMRALLPTGDKS